MGIPMFYVWLKNNFDSSITEIKEITDDNTIDNLMIDFNGMIHPVVRSVLDTHRRRLLRKTPKINEVDIFNKICSSLQNILLLVKPKKRLIIMVDGVAPRSKLSQQRGRRYKNNSIAEDNFDTCCISPCTEFMDKLSKHLDNFISESITSNPFWSGLEVIYSPHNCVGEGEQKCLIYMRMYGNTSESYCIYGLDADIIMLSLGNMYPRMYVLRDSKVGGSYFLLDIGNIREELSNILNWKGDGDGEEENRDFSNKQSIYDFILMCFLVGNDFLPSIQSLEILRGGIDTLISVYKSNGKSNGHITKIVGGNVLICKKSFTEYIYELSKYDKESLQLKMLDMNKYHPDELLIKHSKLVDGKYSLDMEKYMKEFYNEKLTGYNIKDICLDYLEGLQWVITYYTKGVPSWNWYYKYHYAPFTCDLAKYMKTYKQIKYQESFPPSPLLQLMYILSPKSVNLLPKELGTLLIASDSPIKKYYPDEFKIDMSGLKYEWQGIPILPEMNFDEIKEVYDKIVCNIIDKYTLHRNKNGKSFSYIYNKNIYNKKIINL